jgi:hypothetical protein
MKKIILAVCAAAWLGVTGATTAVGQKTYQFVKIVDDAGPFGIDFDPHLSMNDLGVVAFSAWYDDGHARGIYTGDGGTLKTIFEVTEPSNYLGQPSINDSGVVAFYAQSVAPLTDGIYTSDGGARNPIALSGPLQQFQPGSLGRYPAINDSGMVAFSGRRSGPVADYGLYRAGGGPMVTVAEGLLLDPSTATAPSINSAGSVAFNGTFDLNTSNGIYVGNGGGLTTIATGVASDTPSINSSGLVVFRHASSFPGPVRAGNGGPVVTIVDSSGPFSQIIRKATINDLGTLRLLRAWIAMQDTGFLRALIPSPTGSFGKENLYLVRLFRNFVQGRQLITEGKLRSTIFSQMA